MSHKDDFDNNNHIEFYLNGGFEMTRLKAFLVTFTVTFSIMLMCFMGLYWYMQYSQPKAAGETQHNVPILSLTPEDTKTTLVVLDCDEAQFYFLLQLNAIQQKVNVISLPSSFYLSQPQRTLGQSMDYAGVRQCVQDLSQQFDITVDYFLAGDETAFGALIDSFDAIDTHSVELPQSIGQYLLKGNRYVDASTLLTAIAASPALLDNGVGIEFLNTLADTLLQNNLQKLENDVPAAIKENYTLLNTNIGTQELNRLVRIVKLLGNAPVQYAALILENGENAQQQVEDMLKG